MARKFSSCVTPQPCSGNPVDPKPFLDEANAVIDMICLRESCPLSLLGRTDKQIGEMYGLPTRFVTENRMVTKHLLSPEKEGAKRIYATWALLEGIPICFKAWRLIGISSMAYSTYSRRAAELGIVDIIAWTGRHNGYQIKDPSLEMKALQWAYELLPKDFISWAQDAKIRLDISKRRQRGKEKETKTWFRETVQKPRAQARS